MRQRRTTRLVPVPNSDTQSMLQRRLGRLGRLRLARHFLKHWPRVSTTAALSRLQPVLVVVVVVVVVRGYPPRKMRRGGAGTAALQSACATAIRSRATATAAVQLPLHGCVIASSDGTTAVGPMALLQRRTIIRAVYYTATCPPAFPVFVHASMRGCIHFSLHL
jgi:hypothetical protein